MKSLLLLCAIVISLVYGISSGASGPCDIIETVSEDRNHKIVVSCIENNSVTFFLKEQNKHSGLVVVGETKANSYLEVDYHRDTEMMFVTIYGHKFNVRDDTNKAEEAKLMRQLLLDPEFRFFGDAVKLIHDSLQLRGWEEPSVMFLYSLGIAVENAKSNIGLQLRYERYNYMVDPQTRAYHGINPLKRCVKNGMTERNILALIKDECRGVCGKTCKSCWKWVCGDCCKHTGCLRHDHFCDKSGYFAVDCLTVRGVLWDTITNTPYDC